MDLPMIALTVACFVGGILLSRWQARRRLRRHLADQIAREVERELARRAVAGFAESASDPQTRSTSGR